VRRSLAATLGLFFALSGCATRVDVVGQAVVLADRGRYADAAALLGKRLGAHPEDTAARRLLIRIDGLEGNLARARTDAEALAARVGPASPLPWVELGHALELAHRYDEALTLYDRAAEVAPRDPLGPKTGGMRSARWGELELARPRLEESLRRDARDAEVWHALGLVCLRLGDQTAAETAYRSGLVADPRALENHVGLATLALMRERPDDALREFDAVLAERPKRTDAMLGRSLALIELRRFDEAERTLSDAERGGADRAIVAKQRRLLAAARGEVGPDAPRRGVGPSAP
jgi:Flp pilus assembly protein TadD